MTIHGPDRMQFLENSQIDEWRVQHEALLGESAAQSMSSLMTRSYGQAVEPRGQEAEVAAAAIKELGDWDECLLVVKSWGIWPSSEDWPKYYAERGAHGERRSLDVAPGHLFAKPEEPALLRFLQIVLENAWDAEALPASGGRFNGRRLVVSHDEFVEVTRTIQQGYEP